MAFGIGATFDPMFAVKPAPGDERAILFPIAGTPANEVTDAYRTQQLSAMLGMLVGHADGQFHELERKELLDRIEAASDLSPDEKRRLEAEIRLNERDGKRLEGWIKRIKNVPETARDVIATELVALASADGTLHADEVRKLEAIFKRMGLDQKSLYARLQSGTSNIPTAEAAAADRLKPHDKAASATRIDFARLQSIRSETRVTSNVLADIFVEEDDEPTPYSPDAVPDSPGSEHFDGLEQRYGSFLSELLLRSSWAKEDFEHLARDASLMPGAAREAINNWSLDRFDELLIEGEDELEINHHLLPAYPTNYAVIEEGMPA
jgi:tellurite resistance protein